MKNILPIFIVAILFYGCLNDDTENLVYEISKIDSYTVPNSFTFGQKDTIKLKYSLDEGCRTFNGIYYEQQDSARIVGVRTVHFFDKSCSDTTSEFEYNLIVTAIQEEDYVFKFYKGIDNDGKNIFEEVVVPVN